MFGDFLKPQTKKYARNVLNETALTWKTTCKSSASTCPWLRNAHPKGHGCYAAVVVSDVDPLLQETSVFRKGTRYPAVLRFSNGRGPAFSVTS